MLHFISFQTHQVQRLPYGFPIYLLLTKQSLVLVNKVNEEDNLQNSFEIWVDCYYFQPRLHSHQLTTVSSRADLSRSVVRQIGNMRFRHEIIG